MIPDGVITVENLSKRYVIGHEARHDTLRDALAHGVLGWWSALRRRQQQRSVREEFWALRDVAFEVKQGEVVGIIGRNGAGKSTLLKILSRITEPTTGRVSIRGRVASLLEVGTGFHPELTGRENIFLNGAILGMSHAEIRRKFDEIVAFAEVEQFLDTPVKHYSSGMYVRLAFAVAAHLEPEILIVDEVLAVGDAAFQEKCIGRMRQLSSSAGRTVIYVSHNLTSIQLLCSRALLLEKGRVVAADAPEMVVAQFERDLFTRDRQAGATELFPGLSVTVFGFSPEPVEAHQPASLALRFEGPLCGKINELAVFLEGAVAGRVALIDLRDCLVQWRRGGGSTVLGVQAMVKSMPFVEGTYRAGLFIDCGPGLRRDFPHLCPLIISPAAGHEQHPSYPAVHRGVVALQVNTQVT